MLFDFQLIGCGTEIEKHSEAIISAIERENIIITVL